MKRNAESVEVSVSEGAVWIAQQLPEHPKESILLSPDQIDHVIEWLREAKAEAEKSPRSE